MRLHFPIEIVTTLYDKKMPALIFEAMPDTDNSRFKVRFEDGYEDIFSLAGEDGTLGPIGGKLDWLPYSTAIRPDLLIISYLKEGQQVNVFRHVIDGVETNVWVAEERGFHYVYYNQYCRFKFDKNTETNNWRILDNFNGDINVNLDLVQIAGSVIETKIKTVV
jgi:hypothetical protein